LEPHKVEALFDQAGKRRVGRHFAEPVGSQGHHQRANLDVLGAYCQNTWSIT
jgi:hypothetical protein